MILNPDKVYAELIESGEDWADAEAGADLLSEGRRPCIAQLMCEIQGSRTEAEQIALASQTYRDYIVKMVAARKEANIARVRYSAVQTLAELRRTQESTRRQEMKLV